MEEIIKILEALQDEYKNYQTLIKQSKEKLKNKPSDNKLKAALEDYEL